MLHLLLGSMVQVNVYRQGPSTRGFAGSSSRDSLISSYRPSPLKVRQRKHLPTNLWRASIVSCSHSPPRGNESYPRIIRHHSRSSHIRTYLFLYILHLHDRRFLPCLLSTSEHHILISRRTLYRLLCLLDIYCVFHPRQLIN